MNEQDELDLGRIAAFLEGLEETIISKLIDRAQFSVNQVIYEPGQSGFDGAGERSLFELRLRRQEEMDNAFGRFCAPEERPFNRDLPPPSRQVDLPATALKVSNLNAVNVTAEIKTAYLGLIPDICSAGDDGQYGSAVEHDVYALQAIARRVHFGALYVSESKYQSEPAAYRELVDQGDTAGLMERLTRADVEARILDRVAQKVEHLQAQINARVRRAVPPEAIMAFYRNHVIPLTKDGEVSYFRNRTPD
jgi:chorismate mutase